MNVVNAPNRAVFLDRDGTLNEDPGYFHDAEKLVMISGVGEALQKLQNQGFLLVVLTNQGAIAKGLYPVQDMFKVHDAIQQFLQHFGVQITEFFYCPHAEYENCNCRKPRPGLLLAASEKYHLNLAESYVVGDKVSDLQAGKSVGCKTLLVMTGHGRDELLNMEKKNINVADYVVENLMQAASKILLDSNQRGQNKGVE